MAIRSGFFMSVEGDRCYNSSFFAEYFASFIGNGVFPNPSANLQVLEGRDMTIKVKQGKSWINGYILFNDSDYNIKLTPADGVLNRIDRVVLRWDLIDREIKVLVKQGDFATNAVAKELQRDADAYELALADIAVNRGIISITQANITDLRLNKELCGVVHGVVDQVDTTAIFNQFESWYKQTKKNYDADIATWTEEKKQDFDNWYTTNVNEFTSRFETWFTDNTTSWDNEFNTWFDSVKGQLEGDIAANLASQVTDLQNTKAGKTELAIVEEDLATVEEDLASVEEDLESHKAESASIKHKAKEIGLEDASNNFINKTIEGAMNELFLSASNGKTDIASVVGSPATNSNTFTQLKTYIQNAKNKGASNLVKKGTPASGAETLDSIVSKIAGISTGAKWASGTSVYTDSSYNGGYLQRVSGLGFKPNLIIAWKPSEYGDVGVSQESLYIDLSLLNSLSLINFGKSVSGTGSAMNSHYNNFNVTNDGFTLREIGRQGKTGDVWNWIAFGI